MAGAVRFLLLLSILGETISGQLTNNNCFTCAAKNN